MNPRLDELLVERGYFTTLHDAQAAVLAGEVVVGEHRETSAGKRLKPDVELRVKGRAAFASRGGGKLAHALEAFPIDVSGANCIDLGASTGGFTDCLLQNGAAHVCAVDVGAPMMRWELQHDERVDYRSNTDVRGLDPLAVGGPFDVAVADLSFISLTSVLADMAALLKPQGVLVSLVKPQFEVARAQVGEGGIVRDARLHAEAIDRVLQAAGACGFEPRGLVYSPFTGRKGNIEYLFWATRAVGAEHEKSAVGAHSCSCPELQSATIGSHEIHDVVRAAHEQLGGSR